MCKSKYDENCRATFDIPSNEIQIGHALMHIAYWKKWSEIGQNNTGMEQEADLFITLHKNEWNESNWSFCRSWNARCDLSICHVSSWILEFSFEYAVGCWCNRSFCSTQSLGCNRSFRCNRSRAGVARSPTFSASNQLSISSFFWNRVSCLLC